jgi:pimeloyl-ACP methyl ester carboxylesterase
MRGRVPGIALGAVLLLAVAAAFPSEASAELKYGPHPVGFELIQGEDASRSFPAESGTGFRARPLRIYIWYPAQAAGTDPMTVGDFIDLAADDFRLSRGAASSSGAADRLPVPLAKGLDARELQVLKERHLKAFRDIPAASGPFPLLVLGQGLYYESPLAQVYLSEYLASRGYVVATSPLLGTRYRLENLSVSDLETEVRDMEFVLAAARSRPELRVRGLGVVGYDMGGMAGLILAMRNPEVEAFVSLDCGILFPHFSGLPASHPDYREDRFTIPWMHMTQARFIEAGRAEKDLSFLSDRKAFGDTWLVSVPTNSHGQFSSYARFGIRRPLRGYWPEMTDDVERVHDGICRLSGDFLDAVLKKDAGAAERLRAEASGAHPDLYALEFKKGAEAPPSSASLMHLIIERGLAAARHEIDRLRSADPKVRVLDEGEVDWLAYHFLLWWGRESEALDVFRLNVDLNPSSAKAYAGLGEAHMILSHKDEAVAAFRRALELDPNMTGVKAALDGLTKKKEKSQPEQSP